MVLFQIVSGTKSSGCTWWGLCNLFFYGFKTLSPFLYNCSPMAQSLCTLSDVSNANFLPISDML